MSPRKQLRLAIGAYLDDLERKMRESVEAAGKERAATETLAKPTPNNAVLREWARRYGNHPPARPIEVEMRIIPPPWKNAGWTWATRLAGLHLHGSQGWPCEYFEGSQDATGNGNRWLAALSEQVGVKLVPKWKGEQPTKTNPDTPAQFDFGKALTALQAGKRVRRLGWKPGVKLEMDPNQPATIVLLGLYNSGVHAIWTGTKVSDILATDWVVVEES